MYAALTWLPDVYKRQVYCRDRLPARGAAVGGQRGNKLRLRGGGIAGEDVRRTFALDIPGIYLSTAIALLRLRHNVVIIGKDLG